MITGECLDSPLLFQSLNMSSKPVFVKAFLNEFLGQFLYFVYQITYPRLKTCLRGCYDSNKFLINHPIFAADFAHIPSAHNRILPHFHSFFRSFFGSVATSSAGPLPLLGSPSCSGWIVSPWPFPKHHRLTLSRHVNHTENAILPANGNTIITVTDVRLAHRISA